MTRFAKKKDAGKGPNRAQLRAHIERLETKVRYLQGEIAKRDGGDKVRRDGEHWYELTDLLDPSKIRQIPKSPLPGPTYIMGNLGEWIVLEYPPNASEREVNTFMAELRQRGVAPVLAVRAGVRFLRVKTVDPQIEADLDDEVRREREESSKLPGPPADASPRPELHGDGLGDRGSPREADPRGGRDPDREGEGGGAADGGGG